MKFSENGYFFVICNSYIDYLIKKHKSNTFWLGYKGKTVKVSVEVKDDCILSVME